MAQIETDASAYVLDRLCGRGRVRVRLGADDPPVLWLDVYAFQPQTHPEFHLGFWSFRLGPGEHTLDFRLDVSAVSAASVRVFRDGAELESEGVWFNPDFQVPPLLDLHFALWREAKLVYLRRRLIKVPDPDVLRRFAGRQFDGGLYSPRDTFLDQLYHFKLGVLRRWFKHYYRGRVLDVGCGLSLFTQISEPWAFRITAGDLVPGQIKERKRERPDFDWAVFDAGILPVRSASFDGLFAGEILEHLLDPEAGLREWNRALKPGGVLIVTTPNRGRRINLLNGDDWPYSPDHLREFSFEELNGGLLPRAGFRPIKKRGIYLERDVRRAEWWWEDDLQREGNVPANLPRMMKLYRRGYRFPRRSLDLLTAARKVRDL
ncbi:MAG: class I SAM-dependent methyltransferase [Acidobacteriota bacterium]|nr:class I SAM-dependent methyltransferase [Acidobacteriota bacterium]